MKPILIRLLAYSLCLSTVGCCGFCKKLVICNSDEALSVVLPQENRKTVADTISVVVINDSASTRRLETDPSWILSSNPRAFSQVHINLQQLAFKPNYYSSPTKIRSLRHYRFELYANRKLVSTIDGIKTGVVMIDDCQKLQCASIVAFRENGKDYSNGYAHFIRY